MDSATLLSELERLAPTARTLLVAVSGGGDSVALLRLLHGALPGEVYTLHVAHFDHGLRPESADDRRFVQRLCEELELPLTVERAEVGRIAEVRGWNLEDAARRLRYAFLLRTAKRVGAEAVVTAHTQDDVAETVLMQLLRGSAFLRGIPERQGKVVRPLLDTPRSDLRAYLETLRQAWLEDASNGDVGRTRAWVRHEVLSLLEGRYPSVKSALARHARVQRGAADDLEAQARSLFTEGGLEAAPLLHASPALTLAALALLLRDAGIAPDLARLEELRDILGSAHPVRLSLPGGATARLAYGRLEVVRTQEASPLVQAEPAFVLPNDVDRSRLGDVPLYYRTRAPGDWVRLSGGRKKLSDLLIDAKVPRESRDALRLLASAPVGPSEIFWVEGVAVSTRARSNALDDDTRFMTQALALARAAGEAGEVPVGALVVRAGEVLAEASNTTRRDDDPTAHAELEAIREAARTLGDWRLEGCTLYVTLEPCLMCLGAVLSAHLSRLVYGAVNRREGALGGVADLRQHDWKRALTVRGGVLGNEAAELLSTFFASRRAAASP